MPQKDTFYCMKGYLLADERQALTMRPDDSYDK